MVTPRTRALCAASIALLCSAACAGCHAPLPAPTPPSRPPSPTGSPPAVEVVPGSTAIDPGPLLDEDAGIARALGAGPVQPLASSAVSEGDRIGGFVSFEPGACILAFARATARIDDLDLLAYDDAGTPLAVDQATDPKPALVLCPPHPKRVYVSARVAAGHGFAAVGVQALPVRDAPRVAKLFGARLAPPDQAFAQPWPGLDAIIARRRSALGGTWEDLRKVAVSVTPRSPVYLSAPLPANRCLDVLVVPNEETANLEVVLTDDVGRELARAANIGRERTALLCSPVDGEVTVSVRPHDGHGLVAVVIARSSVGDQASLSVRPDATRLGPLDSLEKVRERASVALSRAGFAAKADVGTGSVEPGVNTSVSFDLPSGCSRLDVMSGAPVVGMRCALWSAKNDLVATSEGGEHVTLHGCSTTATRVSLELSSSGRAGPFVVESRAEKSPAPELLRHPLAASRLLGRANAGGTIVAVQDLYDVQRLDLDETRRAQFDVPAAVNTCLHVVAATSAGASGLRLTAVEESNGAALATAHGHTSALLRFCARHRALRVRVFATVEHGRAEGVAARYSTPLASP